MAVSRQEFHQLVADAYNHLYDLFYLRTHPLVQLCEESSSPGSKESAWQLHNLLLKTIQELNPGAQAPTNSNERRRFRIMEMRFVGGMEPQAVAEQLFISRRQFYRELAMAQEACANLLYEQVKDHAGQVLPDTAGNSHEPLTQAVPSSSPSTSRLELVRQESARFQHGLLEADINDTIQTVLSLFKTIAAQRGIIIETHLANFLPAARVDRRMLRQILLGLLNFPLSLPSLQRIHISSAGTDRMIQVTFSIHSSVENTPLLERLSTELVVMQELASLNGVGLHWLPAAGGEAPQRQIDVILTLPTPSQVTVLLADDNPDIRRLICSMLAPRYQVVEAENGEQVIRLAEEAQPRTILLDLMMPDNDGWEALQRLKNSEKTRHIPVVVCSVLDMKDLALSLGAVGYINKPVVAAELISLLDSISGS